MRRARAVRLAALAAAALACGAEQGAPPIAIDLTRLPALRLGETWRAPLVTRDRGAPHLVQPDARPLDLFVRLPEASALRFGLPATLSGDAVGASVASDDRSAALAPVRHADGSWSADLGAFDGQIVRLRLENRSGGRLAWIAPGIAGRVAPDPPLLPAPPPDAAGPWNVLLYVVDTLRPDHLSLYGYERPTSPALDALGERAHVFHSAYATGPNTLTSIPALFTSLSGGEAQDGIRDRRRPTLAGRLSASGYQAAAFQSNFLLKDYLGFGRGFNPYQILFGLGDGALANAAALHSIAFNWIRDARDEPFFLYLQSMDVHNPYRPPPPFLGRFGGDPNATLDPNRYDDAIAYMDHELGNLLTVLDQIGLGDRTIAVVTADHGESLGDRGRHLHGSSLHEEQVRVPLIVALPWAREPIRSDAVVSLMDVAPTLLDLVGAPLPAGFRGSSLTRSGAPGRPRVAAGEIARIGWFLREGPCKLLVDVDGARRLYHLPTDPGERDDRARSTPIVLDYLTGLLWERAPTFRKRRLAEMDLESDLAPADQQKIQDSLRALGYIE